jgi:8-oxo-dGTP diphosphatase
MHTHFPVTIHLLFFRDDHILLLLRANTGYMDGFYSVPAGHLDGNESVREAGTREGFEEVGVRITPINLQFSSVMHRHEGDERVDFFFLVQQWAGEPFNAEPGKCDNLAWVNVNSLPENTVPYVRQAISNHLAGIQYSEFGW